MKIEYKIGDVTMAEEMVFLHGCNTQGVMGSGVARLVKSRYPRAFLRYKAHCNFANRPSEILGQVFPFEDESGVVVLNGITQLNFGGKREVSYEALYRVFEWTNWYAKEVNWPKIAMPRIGSGLGGGNWRIIEVMIEETSTNYIPVVYDLPQ